VSEDLLPRQRSDLRESVLLVVRVHGLNLLFGRRTKNLDDLDQLVDSALSGENGLTQHEFSDDAADRPHIDGSGVV